MLQSEARSLRYDKSMIAVVNKGINGIKKDDDDAKMKVQYILYQYPEVKFVKDPNSAKTLFDTDLIPEELIKKLYLFFTLKV